MHLETSNQQLSERRNNRSILVQLTNLIAEKMVSNKKMVFLRKLTSRGESSKRKGDKNNKNVPASPVDLASNQQNQVPKGCKNSRSVIENKGNGNKADNMHHGSTSSASSPGVPSQSFKQMTIASGLLAAKLRCNEWGLNCPNANSSAIGRKPTTSHPSGDSNSKVNHQRGGSPLNKSHTLQRSRSMKERKQALDKLRKFRNFSSSLSRIEEIDEKGID